MGLFPREEQNKTQNTFLFNHQSSLDRNYYFNVYSYLQSARNNLLQERASNRITESQKVCKEYTLLHMGHDTHSADCKAGEEQRSQQQDPGQQYSSCFWGALLPSGNQAFFFFFCICKHSEALEGDLQKFRTKSKGGNPAAWG